MTQKKQSRKRSIFASPRYWYHISTTLVDKRVYLKPWDNFQGFNRGVCEPNVKRTCVAPSLAHCLTAVPYSPGDKYVVYRTLRRVKANEAHDVFDCRITKEGWIQKPCMFIKTGTLSLAHVSKGEGVNIIEQAASENNTCLSGKVLAWWRRHHLRRYIKPA